jgi:uncharacterized delta-60 repeat protein
MNRSGSISCRVALTLVALGATAGPAYAAPGDLDPTFGRFGKVVHDASGVRNAALDLIVQPNGKLVAPGWTAPGSGATLASTFRFGPDGQLDPSFGDSGVSALDFGLWHQPLSAGFLLGDGTIIIATAAFGTYDGRTRVVLARLRPDGTPDPSFGDGDGAILTDLDAGGTTLDLAPAPGGRIVVATGARGGGFLVARFLAEGDPDPSFSDDGVATTAVTTNGTANTVVVDTDGGVIAAGDGRYGPGSGVTMVRYRPDGELDPAFGSQGVAAVGFGEGRSVLGELALQPDRRLVLAGTLQRGDGVRHVVARYSPQGRPDPTFSADGLAKLKKVGFAGALEAVAIGSDGRIVAGGQSKTDFFLTRLRPDGKLDRSFSRDGRLRTGLGGDGDSVTALALQPDGRIVAAGYRADIGFRSNYLTVALARYLIDGRRHDADADGRRDRRDRCPNLSATGHRGCPFFSREISLDYDAEGAEFTGRIDAENGACAHAGRIQLVRPRPGADRVLASRRTHRRGNDFRFRFADPSGRFYARAPEAVAGGTGLCGYARSRITRL